MERKKISDDYKVDVELLTVLNPDKNAPFFYISRMGVPVPFDEAWQSYLGGLFKLAPIPVFYKKFYQPAELLLAITSHSSFGPPLLPLAVQEALQQANTTSYDYSFIISDVSSMISLPGQGSGSNNNVINLSHHAWYFPDTIYPEVMNGRRIEVPIQVGAFTYQHSGIAPMDKTCLPFQTLDTLPMTVHPQKGGLCCSPNNARFVLKSMERGGGPIAHMWVVTIAGEEGEGKEEHGLQASVSLQWIIHQPLLGLAGQLKACKNVQGVLDFLVHTFGREEPAVVAARMMMMGERGDGIGYGVETETGPMKNERREQGNSNSGGGGRRGGRGGRRGYGGDRGRGTPRRG